MRQEEKNNSDKKNIIEFFLTFPITCIYFLVSNIQINQFSNDSFNLCDFAIVISKRALISNYV